MNARFTSLCVALCVMFSTQAISQTISRSVWESGNVPSGWNDFDMGYTSDPKCGSTSTAKLSKKTAYTSTTFPQGYLYLYVTTAAQSANNNVEVKVEEYYAGSWHDISTYTVNSVNCGTDNFSISPISTGIRVNKISAAGTLNLTNVTVSQTSAPLPVELKDFRGIADKNNTLLTWTTASEIDNDGFEVLHSTNGEKFNTIEFIPGNGNSSKELKYEFMHRNAPNGTNYYKLRQLDLDGSVNYSNTISVVINEKANWNVYPTSILNTCTIALSDTDLPTKADIISMSNGKLVKSEVLANNRNKIDLSDLTEGYYIVQVQNESNIQRFKIVKL